MIFQHQFLVLAVALMASASDVLATPAGTGAAAPYAQEELAARSTYNQPYGGFIDGGSDHPGFVDTHDHASISKRSPEPIVIDTPNGAIFPAASKNGIRPLRRQEGTADKRQVLRPGQVAHPTYINGQVIPQKVATRSPKSGDDASVTPQGLVDALLRTAPLKINAERRADEANVGLKTHLGGGQGNVNAGAHGGIILPKRDAPSDVGQKVKDAHHDIQKSSKKLQGDVHDTVKHAAGDVSKTVKDASHDLQKNLGDKAKEAQKHVESFIKDGKSKVDDAAKKVHKFFDGDKRAKVDAVDIPPAFLHGDAHLSSPIVDKREPYVVLPGSGVRPIEHLPEGAVALKRDPYAIIPGSGIGPLTHLPKGAVAHKRDPYVVLPGSGPQKIDHLPKGAVAYKRHADFEI